MTEAKPSVWDLIKDGRFQEAADMAEKQSAETGSLLPLRNKVIAQLNDDQLDSAIEVSRRIIKLNGGKTDSDYIFLGLAYWLRRERESAVRAWREGSNTDYTDAAGGVEIPMLIMFGASRLRDAALHEEAIGIVKKVLGKRTDGPWPVPIARYCIGAMSEEMVRQKIPPASKIGPKLSCQANFYFAMNACLRGDHVRSNELLGEAGVLVEPMVLLRPEYYLAKYELAQARE